jgi:hypothetical protein
VELVEEGRIRRPTLPSSVPQKPENTILEGRGARCVCRLTLGYSFRMSEPEASGDDKRLRRGAGEGTLGWRSAYIPMQSWRLGVAPEPL